MLEQFPEQFLGKLAGRFRRFPLLLKFLDAHEMLSVQVHPRKANTNLLPAGETAKTEAWVVLEAATESRIYAGLKPGITAAGLRQAITNGSVPDDLVWFTPKPGDAVFLPAGTVHSLGGDVVVFEIQQNSDVTFRLYDWGHVDAKTGQPRALQVDQAIACIDFAQGAAGLVAPVVEGRRRWNARNSSIVSISGCGACEENRRLRSVPPVCRVCWYALRARDTLEHEGAIYSIGKGDVLLLPAVVGACTFSPAQCGELVGNCDYRIEIADNSEGWKNSEKANCV